MFAYVFVKYIVDKILLYILSCAVVMFIILLAWFFITRTIISHVRNFRYNRQFSQRKHDSVVERFYCIWFGHNWVFADWQKTDLSHKVYKQIVLRVFVYNSHDIHHLFPIYSWSCDKMCLLNKIDENIKDRRMLPKLS